MVKFLPTQIAIAAFHEQDTADAAALALAKGRANGDLHYTNLATVQKDLSGKVKVRESGDLNVDVSTAYSASAGALLGGLSCVLLGPTGVAAGAAAGAVIGGAGSKLLLKGSLDKDRVKQLGNSLMPGCSAIIAVFDELPIEKELWKTEEVQQVRDELVYQLAKDVGESLRNGEDVAYLYAVTPEGIVGTRMASGEEAADFRGFIVSEEGIAIGEVAVDDNVLVYEAAASSEEGIEATAGVLEAGEEGAGLRAFVVTEDGVAFGEVAANDTMLVYEAAAITEEGVEATAGVVVAEDDPLEQESNEASADDDIANEVKEKEVEASAVVAAEA